MLFGKKKNWDDKYDEYYTQQDPEYGRRSKPLLWIHFSAIATLAGVFLVIVGASAGGTMVEKVAKELCTPVGLIWIGLALLTYFALVYKVGRTAITAFLLWLLLTIGGNWFVANYMASSLEQPYKATNPFEEEPFDCLIVLGGGTQISPSGTPQLGTAGDRVMTIARMYHLGKVKKIISSGRQKYKSDPKDLHPNEETIRILSDLNIPQSDLMMLGGTNTSEEMKQVRKWLDSDPEFEKLRIGIVTSAWHLPRAMALAEENNINAVPVPSNFVSEVYSPNPSIIVPSARNLNTTAEMLSERLGRIIGR